MPSTTRPTSKLYFGSIEHDVRAFVVAARKGLDAAVPTCPGWTVRDLLVHTGVIHRRKHQVIEDGLTDRETAVSVPEEGLIEWFEQGAELMLTAFRARTASDSTWTWHKPDQTVGFWYRRMAHETLIHRVDAELSHGEASEVDEAIANDGIDEAFNVFIGGYPEWAALAKGNQVIRLSSPTTSWRLRTGNFSGTTRSGKILQDVATVLLESEEEPANCEISGTAAALNLWLWGRGPVSDLEVSGDAELANYLRTVAANST